MKKSVLLPALLFSSLLLLNMRCEKDKTDPYAQSQESLPPYSAWGANTFGCTLNGKNWVAYTDYSFPKLRVDFDPNSGSLQIIADRKEKNKDGEEIQIVGYYIKDKKKYVLGSHLDTILTNGYSAYSPSNFSGYLYYSDTTHLIKLNIHQIDKLNRVIAGTFEGNLLKHDSHVSSDSVMQILEGRFDLHY